MTGRKLLLSLIVTGLIFCGCQAGIDKARFDRVDRAARSAKDSLSAGVNYEGFGELLKNFSAEIARVRESAKSEREVRLVDAYLALLGIYRDGHLLWKYRSEFKRYDFVPQGLIYVGQDVEPVAAKYHFPVESHIYGPTNTAWKSIPEDSINTVWFNADAQLKLIHNMLDEP